MLKSYMVGDIIEEADLFRLEIVKKFMNDYIMPLA
jgi:hypothetical protein